MPGRRVGQLLCPSLSMDVFQFLASTSSHIAALQGQVPTTTRAVDCREEGGGPALFRVL